MTIPISRLTLGTVQFGLPYGVANRSGQPSLDVAKAIVRTAFEGGITTLDTAAAYGNSEEILGRLLADLGLHEQLCIVTKVPALDIAVAKNPESAERFIRQSIEQSCRRLGLEALPLVLFHQESDAVHLPVLRELMREGKIAAIGVSCDHDGDATAKLVATESVDAVQIPVNLLDRRHLQSELRGAAAPRNVSLFARSAYLQGLLTMDDGALPPWLAAIRPARKQLAELAEQAGLSLPDMAFRWLLGVHGLTSIVVGVETVEQMANNLELWRQGPLPVDLQAELNGLEWELPFEAISPRCWPALEAAWKAGNTSTTHVAS